MNKVIAFLLACIMVLSKPVTVFANEQDNLDINDVQAEMEEFLQETALSFEVENFTVVMRSDVDLSLFSDEEITDLLQRDIDQMKAIMLNTENRLYSQPQTRLANHGGGQYTAEVWAGVPSIGWSTVKQDFVASVSGGTIYSVAFSGDGYMDGVSWGQYSHIRSWYDIYSNSTKVDIHIKGSINYLFNLVNTNYTATFLEKIQANGNVLERQW